MKTRLTAPLPADHQMICSVCGLPLKADCFSPAQQKKRYPRCRNCAPNKFGNRQSADGHQSRRESKRAMHLRSLLAVGAITHLREQVPYEIIPAQRDEQGKVIEKSCIYIADFVYHDGMGQLHVEDSKGCRTKEYRIKRKLMLLVHRIRIEEV